MAWHWSRYYHNPAMPRVPQVSIVMPVKNAGASLRLTLQSILAQTFSDWELLAVDDGSEDDTPSILECASRSDCRIRCIRGPHRGIVAALQTACAAARGAFVARMDADDWMMPERLRTQWDYLRLFPEIGVASCQVRYGGDPSRQAGYALHVAWVNSLSSPTEMTLRRFVESPVAHPGIMFRRELLHQHGGYRDGDFPEDYELWLRWMEAGVQFGKVDTELLVWNDPPGRLSRKDPRYRVEAFYKLKCLYLSHWIRTHVPISRQLWLWGAGRVTRERFRLLETYGVRIQGFIDVDVKKLGRMRDGRLVVSPEELPAADRSFIIAGVSSRGARELIVARLESCGRKEGVDYLLAA